MCIGALFGTLRSAEIELTSHAPTIPGSHHEWRITRKMKGVGRDMGQRQEGITGTLREAAWLGELLLRVAP